MVAVVPSGSAVPLVGSTPSLLIPALLSLLRIELHSLIRTLGLMVFLTALMVFLTALVTFVAALMVSLAPSLFGPPELTGLALSEVFATLLVVTPGSLLSVLVPLLLLATVLLVTLLLVAVLLVAVLVLTRSSPLVVSGPLAVLNIPLVLAGLMLVL